MRERRTSPRSPPPPRGAGAGGGGRAGYGADDDARADRIPPPESADRTEGSLGWNGDRTRQRDFTRTNARAKRLRREMTPAENALWALLRAIPDAHFRKQAAVDNR